WARFGRRGERFLYVTGAAAECIRDLLPANLFQIMSDRGTELEPMSIGVDDRMVDSLPDVFGTELCRHEETLHSATIPRCCPTARATESGRFVHTVIKHIVEIDIREQRRCAAALRRTCLHLHSLPVLQHARVQLMLWIAASRRFDRKRVI